MRHVTRVIRNRWSGVIATVLATSTAVYMGQRNNTPPASEVSPTQTGRRRRQRAYSATLPYMEIFLVPMCFALFSCFVLSFVLVYSYRNVLLVFLGDARNVLPNVYLGVIFVQQVG